MTGNLTVTVVPWPGAESIIKDPFKALTRSLMFIRPKE